MGPCKRFVSSQDSLEFLRRRLVVVVDIGMKFRRESKIRRPDFIR